MARYLKVILFQAVHRVLVVRRSLPQRTSTASRLTHSPALQQRNETIQLKVESGGEGFILLGQVLAVDHPAKHDTVFAGPMFTTN